MAGVRSVEGWGVWGSKRPPEFGPAARAKRRTGRQAAVAPAWQQRGSSVRPPGGLVQVDYSSVIAPVGSAQYMQFVKRSVQKPCAVLDGSERLGVHASALHLS